MTRKLTGGTLLFATHNLGKLAEMRDLLSPHGITVVSAVELSLAAPLETEDSFAGNARIKAHAAARATGLVALADDSGLCVDALDGAPGVYTADWAETAEGRNFGLAMERTHAALLAITATEPWRATFWCVLALAWPDGQDTVFEGSVSGTLVWPIRGTDGHGYDPMFVPEGYTKSFAEMSEGEKNTISHRNVALRKLLSACFT